MLCYTMLCYAIICCTILCHAMLYLATLCHATLYMLCYAMLYYVMLCYAMLFYAIPYCFVEYNLANRVIGVKNNQTLVVFSQLVTQQFVR